MKRGRVVDPPMESYSKTDSQITRVQKIFGLPLIDKVDLDDASTRVGFAFIAESKREWNYFVGSFSAMSASLLTLGFLDLNVSYAFFSIDEKNQRVSAIDTISAPGSLLTFYETEKNLRMEIPGTLLCTSSLPTFKV